MKMANLGAIAPFCFGRFGSFGRYICSSQCILYKYITQLAQKIMGTKLVIHPCPPARTLITNFVLSLFSGLDMLYIYIIYTYKKINDASAPYPHHICSQSVALLMRLFLLPVCTNGSAIETFVGSCCVCSCVCFRTMEASGQALSFTQNHMVI